MRKLLKTTLFTLLSMLLTLCIFIAGILFYFELQLPNIDVLKNIQLQVPLSIYSADGKLIGEYGPQRRMPIDLNEIPKQLIEAVVATEDQRYFEHGGIDIRGLLRASYELVSTGTKSQGGSTITMQVARNFFLTRKKTYKRKIKEILLAIKINSLFSKDKILELYLNKIYFGNRAYGIAAAAHVYYGKPLNQLSLPQIAMLAGLPKAPSGLNPLANPKGAIERRDHVLERMHDLDYIDTATYKKALKAPITASYHGLVIQLKAPYIAEMVRDAMVERYGEEKAYTEGYRVFTTVSSRDQIAANHAVAKALIDYSMRHGYHGPEANLGNSYQTALKSQWQQQLTQFKTSDQLQAVAITGLNPQSATALLANGNTISIPFASMQWAGKELKDGYKAPPPKQPSDFLHIGDVVRVIKLKNSWALRQLPRVQGALVALNPKNGAILALVGGFNYTESKFNRAIQAYRQPGSNFKPFIYAAALAKGYTLATMINDAPVVVNDPSQINLWRPENDTRKFYGPTRLKVGLTKSRNLVSIRLLEDIGVNYAVNYVMRFGFNENQLPKGLSLALGSAIVTPLQIATGYAVFANGGYQVKPFLIDHITDDENNIIYQARPKTACETCTNLTKENNILENLASNAMAPRVISPQVAYLMTDAMKDVITQGTGRRALVLKRPDLAGKTGTTNKQIDAWFSGFNSNIVTSCWVGFDIPKTLREYGAQAALPMWIDFMRQALKNSPRHSMSQPPGIIAVRIDPKTGLLARPGDTAAIFELFRQRYAPKRFSSQSNFSQPQAVENSQNSPSNLFDRFDANKTQTNDDSEQQPIY
ncbi:MAG: penicillin-binding protein 1A [Pseudomonadota bacterium]